MITPTADAVLEQLSVNNAQVLNLLALCRAPEYNHIWSETPKLLRRFARLLLKQGHPTLALEVASRGLDKLYPGDHDLMYCRALALWYGAAIPDVLLSSCEKCSNAATYHPRFKVTFSAFQVASERIWLFLRLTKLSAWHDFERPSASIRRPMSFAATRSPASMLLLLPCYQVTRICRGPSLCRFATRCLPNLTKRAKRGILGCWQLLARHFSL